MTGGPHPLLIVGAGPAGIAAALTAADAGCPVTVFDAGRRPGGQYYRQPPAAFGQPLPKPIRRLLAHPRITVESETTVVAAEPQAGGAVLHILRSDGSITREQAPAVVLATGAYDRPLPFPGWTLPGVFTAGGAQALIKGEHVLPGKRIVVAGTGPFLLPVAAALATGGVHVVGVFEANHPGNWTHHLPAALTNPAKIVEAARYGRVLAAHQIPFRYRHAVVRAEGAAQVESVMVARLGRDWTPVPGSLRRYDVDAVCVGFGFVPSVELAEALGCALELDTHGAPVVATTDAVYSSVDGVYVAGEASGVSGVVTATVEGCLAGAAAAYALGYPAPRVDERRLRRQRTRARALASALDGVYPLRPGWQAWLDPDTMICRCEEVSAGQVRAALDAGMATDLRSVKLQTRVGMGMCQGRMCAASVAALVEAGTGLKPDARAFVRRPFTVPVPLASLASLSEIQPPDQPRQPAQFPGPKGLLDKGHQ